MGSAIINFRDDNIVDYKIQAEDIPDFFKTLEKLSKLMDWGNIDAKEKEHRQLTEDIFHMAINGKKDEIKTLYPRIAKQYPWLEGMLN